MTRALAGLISPKAAKKLNGRLASLQKAQPQKNAAAASTVGADGQRRLEEAAVLKLAQQSGGSATQPNTPTATPPSSKGAA